MRCPVPNGVVQWFDDERGVGLIARGGESPDTIAERSAIHGPYPRTLSKGDRVLFDVMWDADGVRADDIHRLPPGRPRGERDGEGGGV